MPLRKYWICDPRILPAFLPALHAYGESACSLANMIFSLLVFLALAFPGIRRRRRIGYPILCIVMPISLGGGRCLRDSVVFVSYSVHTAKVSVNVIGISLISSPWLAICVDCCLYSSVMHSSPSEGRKACTQAVPRDDKLVLGVLSFRLLERSLDLLCGRVPLLAIPLMYLTAFASRRIERHQ